MDNVSSMLFDQDTDDLFHFSSIPFQQYTIQHSKMLLTPSEDGEDLINKPENSQRRKLSISFGVNDENPNDKKQKKIIHRDIERQRRQEMATLHTSLRSLLPTEYLKGKRSISDHIHGAANYIKDLEDKIQELSEKREELKRLSNSDTPSCAPECSQSCQQDIVTVKSCWLGVEVAINTALRHGIPLSSVLGILIEEGLSIVSCMSNKVNERLLHSIKSEVSEGRGIYPSELQQKLTNLIK